MGYGDPNTKITYAYKLLFFWGEYTSEGLNWLKAWFIFTQGKEKERPQAPLDWLSELSPEKEAQAPDTGRDKSCSPLWHCENRRHPQAAGGDSRRNHSRPDREEGS